MRAIASISLLILASLGCSSQQKTDTIVKPGVNEIPGEFAKSENGLIYSEQDINALRFVVDSLNLKFKSCDLYKNYYAYPQAKVCAVTFSDTKNDLKDIINSIKSGEGLNALLKQYKSFVSKVDSNLLAVKTHSYDEEKYPYLLGNAFNGFENDYILEGKKNLRAGQCYYNYDKKDEYTKKNSVDCIFLLEDFSQTIIPANYARLIQYVDCMIDTNATIFLTNKKDDPFSSRTTDIKCETELNEFLNGKMEIKKNKDEYTWEYLTEEKATYAIDSLKHDPFVIKKVNELYSWYSQHGGSNDAGEDLIAAFISKEKALQLKRHRRVMGMCSQDRSPRVHAKNIAMLAAETHSWDIFLRSHLDIMNDRFDRMSDGSYAWGSRQTYLKELEALDINVIDMMTGLSLRAYNVSDNHYNGTVWRIGKALGDSKDRVLFEEKAKGIMKDNSLDQFNRDLMFLLYHTYLNYLPDKNERKLKITSLKENINEYPDFIRSGINEMKLDQKD